MRYAYIGCRTTKERGARGKGIQVYSISDDQEWEHVQTVGGLVNPSFLTLDGNGDFLYTVHGDRSEISSFSVDKSTGRLEYINTVSTEGTNPVHLSIDRTGRWIFVANLQTGTVVTVGRNEDGSLSPVVSRTVIPGKEEGTVSHPHQVAQDISRKYLLVSCQGRAKGFGQVDVFRIDSGNGSLELTCRVRSREIAEPRHIAFHSAGAWCYGVNEKDYSVTSYSFSCGQLVPRQILPTLPETYTGDGWASGIVMSPDDSVVVVSNRKHDSLTSFLVDKATGLLRYSDCVKTGGGQPRFITFTPWGTVLAANELSDTVTEFKVDKDGHFSSTGFVLSTESPVCLVFS